MDWFEETVKNISNAEGLSPALVQFYKDNAIRIKSLEMALATVTDMLCPGDPSKALSLYQAMLVKSKERVEEMYRRIEKNL